MASQLHGNNYWHSHNQACFQVERSACVVSILKCQVLSPQTDEYNLFQAHVWFQYSNVKYFHHKLMNTLEYNLPGTGRTIEI